MPEAKEKEVKQEKPKEDPKVAVPKLLNQLKNATEQAEKRKIRAHLRSLGHTGGLPPEMRPKREPPKKKEKAEEPTGKSKAAPAKKPSRAAGA